ncbi:MAG: shikimate dehydrogenase, partial [Lachnospiraceae bacterium]|nr:shikimate dehydrogenase [Lachnospiraceae bacterium]
AGRELARAMANEAYKKLPQGEKFLVIQATSVGMHPHDEDVVIADEAFYEKIHTGYDLIFNPAQTRFMKLVQAHGGRAFNGAKMLLYQGVIAYEYWTDTQITEAQAETVFAAMQR